jgi:hypothetical protein
MERIITQDFNSLKDLHVFEQNLINNLKPTLNSIKASIIEESIKDTTDDIEDHWVMTSYKPSDSIEEHKDSSSDKSPLLFIIDLG